MLATIIVLSIIVILLIAYIIVISLQKKNDTDKAYKKGADDLFSAILANGWEKKVNDFKEYNKCVNENGIVFVGDSLTDNYNVYEYFKGYDVYNRGIGGDTTVGLLKRMKESVYDLKPSIVVLLIGINDFELVENSTPQTIYENITKIVSEIHKNLPATKIILESLYPVNKSTDSKIDQPSVMRKDNSKINEVNEKIKTIQGVYYLNMHDLLLDNKKELKLEYTMEGLHINTLGYHFVTKVIKDKIEEINHEAQ